MSSGIHTKLSTGSHNITHPFAVDYDPTTQTVYWGDAEYANTKGLIGKLIIDSSFNTSSHKALVISDGMIFFLSSHNINVYQSNSPKYTHLPSILHLNKEEHMLKYCCHG